MDTIMAIGAFLVCVMGMALMCFTPTMFVWRIFLPRGTKQWKAMLVLLPIVLIGAVTSILLLSIPLTPTIQPVLETIGSPLKIIGFITTIMIMTLMLTPSYCIARFLSDLCICRFHCDKKT